MVEGSDFMPQGEDRERGGGNGGQGATAASGGSDSTVATEEEADREGPLSVF